MAPATDRELALTTGVNTAMKTMRDAARAFPMLYDDDQDRARRARHLVEQYGVAYQDLVGTIDEAEGWLDPTQTELDLIRTTRLALPQLEWALVSMNVHVSEAALTSSSA